MTTDNILPPNARILRVLSIVPMTGPVDLEIDGEHSGSQCPECRSHNTRPISHRDDFGSRVCSDCEYAGAPGDDFPWMPIFDIVVIAGGDKPLHPQWVRDALAQCEAAGVVLVFLGWGEWGAGDYIGQTGAPVIRQFNRFEDWVNHAQTWIHGGMCLDTGGNILTCGGDMMAARDNDRFPVAILHRIGREPAGRLLDGKTYDWPVKI